MKHKLKTLVFSFLMLFLMNSISYEQGKLSSSINKYDSNIYKMTKIFKLDPVMFKAICMQESKMQDGVARAERGYSNGKYLKMVKRQAKQLKIYADSNYGFSLSLQTYIWQLSMSWGISQIMGSTAFSIGWRGLSYANSDYGLANIDTCISYSEKLLKQLVNRYNNDTNKIISAYNHGKPTPKNYKIYVIPVLGYMKKFEHDFEKYEEKDTVNKQIIDTAK